MKNSKRSQKTCKKISFSKKELVELSSILEENPTTGTSLGNNAYKIRIAIKSKGSGKSGGARVITYVVIENKEVYLLTIYDKGELDSVDDNTLRKIIRDIKAKE